MSAHVNSIANRLSLRSPQRDSLEILHRVCEIAPLGKNIDLAQSLKTISSEFPTVTDFERDFPSLCFALATGVGKTRLMGAFIAYLHKAEGVRHFFVLAPNLTIYNKLIADFTPNTPKYVFQGISEFAINPPEIITGDNYESGRGIRGALFDTDEIHINIFNISKINSEVRGGSAPRIKRLSEYIGESYFSYLSKLDDLVLLMDESHRYRASAGVRAINELKPILGLELTATPFVEAARGPIWFKNTIYSYPLSSALTDGFVKEPAVATRENFDVAAHTAEALEKLKLEDGIRVHEETKVQLEAYATENNVRRVKPFVLVVAKDVAHAEALRGRIEADDFFQGQYKGKVITVHSKTGSEEKDEVVQQLLTVEDPANAVEIVIHVNMLKEGWDVTNLYTIVPLRPANARTLVEQSIGRGLRLPYGKRVGVAPVDRLTIVAHDKFQEIIDEANKGDSILVKGVIIGKDIPDQKSQMVVVESKITEKITGKTSVAGTTETTPSLFEKPEEVKVAQAALQVIQQFQKLSKSADLKKPEVQKELVEKVTAAVAPIAGEQLEAFAEKVDIAAVVAKTTDLHIDLTIDIPRIIVVPSGTVSSGFADFDLDPKDIRLQPVSQEILIQHLHDHSRHNLMSGEAIATEKRLEDYLVRGLIDFPDINYDEQAQLLYKLAGQMVAHLRTYLKDEADVLNVLQAHQKALVHFIHGKMEQHYHESATAYEATVTKGFTTMRPSTYTMPAGEKVRNFRTPVEEKQLIKGMLFTGFSKCLYPAQKFDSDPERRLAVILENDKTVQKWFRSAKGDFQIHWSHDQSYEPDFVVETETSKFLVEPKRSDQMNTDEVQAKARAAALWCKNATENTAGKPWSYVLIPHDVIDDSKTLAGLAASFAFVSG